MIVWNELDHMHVIKKLREILSSWWNIDVLFADTFGNIKSPEFDKLNNEVVKKILDSDEAKVHLSALIADQIAKLANSKEDNVIINWDYCGLDCAIFPIVMNGNIMGAVITLGFFKDKNRVSTKLESFSEININDIYRFDDYQIQHFLDLSTLVAKEVVTFQIEIANRDERINELNQQLGSKYKYDDMIGQSKSIRKVYALLNKIKSTESTVLIQGENGTGKELIARSVHYNSPRKDKPFVIQNCSAFNDNLLESELFGHAKGAFTGAIREKKGLFEEAHKGTFFLDEIGDTSPAMQVKLLRVVQEGTFTPVGSVQQKHVDVRIIAATNKPLAELVEKKLFREDLYYRLNVVDIYVPPLRERREDIPLLVEYFLNGAQDRTGKRKTLSKIAMEKFCEHKWPGNIRELQNEIERLVIISSDEKIIDANLLSSRITKNVETNVPVISDSLKGSIKNIERHMIIEGLKRTGGNKSKLARELGISRAGLLMKISKYDLDKKAVNEG